MSRPKQNRKLLSAFICIDFSVFACHGICIDVATEEDSWRVSNWLRLYRLDRVVSMDGPIGPR